MNIQTDMRNNGCINLNLRGEGINYCSDSRLVTNFIHQELAVQRAKGSGLNLFDIHVNIRNFLSVPYSAYYCCRNLVLVACRQNFDLENKDNSIKHKYRSRENYLHLAVYLYF